MQQFLRFGVVGTFGFLVDAGILLTLTHFLEMSPFLARVISFAVAVFSTWLIHRRWTFSSAGQGKNPLKELAQFFSAQSLGICVNYACFSVLILMGAPFSNYPVLALAIASALAMTLNYVLARRYVFVGQDHSGNSESESE